MVENHTGIVTARSRSQWPLLPNAHAIDLARVPADLSHGVAAIRCDAVPKFLFAVANSNDTLTVSIPCKIIDASTDDRVFAFRRARAIRDAVPNSDGTSTVSGCTVVA